MCHGISNFSEVGRIHPLKGKWKGYWSLSVKENWRIIFRFAGPDAFDVDYIDYH